MAACGEAHTLLVDVQGIASGLGDSGQLGLEDNWSGMLECIPRRAFKASGSLCRAGTAFSVAVTEGGRVYQWGVDFGTQPFLANLC